MTVQPDVAAIAPADFTVLLPPGWVRIRIGDDTQAQVVALATARARPFPPERRAAVRTALTRLLAHAVTEARRAAAVDLLLSVDSVEGIPVPASCLVSYLDGGDARLPDDGVLLEQLAEPGAELAVRDIDAGTAVRRSLTRLLPATVPSASAAVPAGTVTEVTWFLRVPGRGGLLALTFSTPAEELAPALVTLFDAMAASLKWISR